MPDRRGTQRTGFATGMSAPRERSLDITGPSSELRSQKRLNPFSIFKLWINKAAGAVQEQRNNFPIWIILIFSVIYKGLRRTLDTNPRRPVSSQSLGSIRHPLELSLDLHHGRQVELKSRAAPRGADRP